MPQKPLASASGFCVSLCIVGSVKLSDVQWDNVVVLLLVILALVMAFLGYGGGPNPLYFLFAATVLVWLGK